MLAEIHKSILNTKGKITEHNDYPESPGIYCFFIASESELKEFGTGRQVMYVGIAKNTLKARDLGQHFRTGQTGRSTLRRSIGAILKEELSLKAIPRGGKNDSLRIDNYKFEETGDKKLTKWMIENLEIGYWEDKDGIEYNELRALEKEYILKTKPTLDLDNRTRKYNPLADRLTCLRNTCKMEVCEYIKKNEKV